LEIKPSRRAQSVKSSSTLATAARAAALVEAGRAVLNLAGGELGAASPDHVRAAAVAAIAAGCDGYTAVDGTPALKQAIRAKFERDNGFEFAPEQILVTNGCKHALFNLMQALLDDDDEVVIPAPYWTSYPDMARLAGADPVIVRTRARNGYKMTPEQLRGALGPRTRLVILNSPNNPTGAVYTRAELEALGQVLLDFPEVVIASDDVYEHLCWAPAPFANLLNAFPRLHQRTVILNGVSKAYAMAGWRIGYAAGPANLVAAMRKIQSQSISHPAAVAQAAATAALAGPQGFLAEQRAQLRKRHDLLYAELSLVPGLEVRPADGAFYLLADVRGVIERLDGVDDDVALAAWLLEEGGIATVPGSAFGAPDSLRLTFTAPLDALRAAIGVLRGLLG